MAETIEQDEKVGDVLVSVEDGGNKSTDSTGSKPWITWILIGINISLVIVATTVIILWRQHPRFVEDSGDLLDLHETICLKCEDIGVQKDRKESLQGLRVYVAEDKSWVCCGEGELHLDRLVDLNVEKMYTYDNRAYQPSYPECMRSKEDITSQKPAARVVGVTEETLGTVQDSILGWERYSAQSFVHPNITYDEGRFTVLSSGLYYVYTQISLKNSIPSTHMNDTETLFHSVFKLDAESQTDETLLESFDPHCKLLTTECKRTSYVGAVFSLNAKDEIYVKCSQPSKISDMQLGNYFGLHMI